MEVQLKKIYNKNIKNDLIKHFNYKNIMMVPKIEKIIINMGLGIAIQDKKKLDSAVNELSTITGQKAVKTKSKKSIANFKLRDGMEIGCKVTLRGDRMYEFLERLINYSIPSIKDFRGLNPNSFDGYGNYTFGIKEHIIFPEIDYDKIEDIKGMNITITTTAKTDEEAKMLLEKFNFPFRKK
ncbi:MAG: 50S ribosomal protein L5 [Spirochaetes bacterium]|nr:50S ribosomal protein L5 [Spirochaetota bacterium]